MRLWTITALCLVGAAPRARGAAPATTARPPLGAPAPVVDETLRQAATLKTLKISDTAGAPLLEQIGRFVELEELRISCLEDLKVLPAAIGSLHELKTLRLDNGNGCTMNPRLPESLGQLAKLRTLVLYGAQDNRSGDGPPGPRQPFPRALGDLHGLTVLSLGRNGLREVPAFVARLGSLKELDLSWNELTTLPDTLGALHELETLRLDGNRIPDLPDALVPLPKLRSVALGGNCAVRFAPALQDRLRRRFPRVVFDFSEELDCD